MATPAIMRPYSAHMPEQKFIQTTLWLTFYLRDGTIEQYDLSDPKIPLPRFRSLVSQEPTMNKQEIRKCFADPRNSMERAMKEGEASGDEQQVMQLGLCLLEQHFLNVYRLANK